VIIAYIPQTLQLSRLRDWYSNLNITDFSIDSTRSSTNAKRTVWLLQKY